VAWTNRLKTLVLRVLNRKRVEEELNEEVDSYFDILVARHIGRGLSREQARRAARVEFEGPEQVKEKVREVRIGAEIETTLRDIGYAWRVLRRSPVFTIVAVLTLALGIGANTAIFTLINAVMLRALPVEHPEQLVLLTDPAVSGISTDTTERGLRERMSYPEFEELRAHNTVFSGMVAAQNEANHQDVFRDAGPASQPVKAYTQLVSGDFFRLLGVRPVLGRTFTAEEDNAPGANPLAVISHGFWQREFAGDRGIVGRTFRVGQGVFQIVGVAPAGFRGILVGSDTDLWIPITMQEQVLPGRNYLKPRDTLWVHILARLSPATTIGSAEAATNVAFQQILQAQAADAPIEKERRDMLLQRIELRPGARGASTLRGQFSDPLVLLMAMVGVVLLIACANIANLMLVRATGRQREIGIRLAIGAGRARLIRQLLTESLLIAALGGMLGILMASVGARVLVALVSARVDGLELEISHDYRVLLFTTAVSLATGILFGLLPAIRATRMDLNRALAADARGSIGGHGRVQTGRILAILQIALSLVLLLGSALFVRSLHNMLTQDLGFERYHLLMVGVDPVTAGYKESEAKDLYEKARAELRRIPGVRNVTLSNTGLFGGESRDRISLDGSPIRDPQQLRSFWTLVGPDYFSTLGIPLLQGREITTADAVRGLQVCVVNESFARRFFPNSDAIGHHVTDEYPSTRETFEIVGVVSDSREHRPNEMRGPRFYANIHNPIGTVDEVTFLLNTSGEPSAVASAVRQSLQRLDRNLPIWSLRTVNEQIDRRLITERLMAQLAAFFGVVALSMAAIGLYGVISHSITRRKSEIGIRMALGATERSVVRMVLGETLGIVAVGMVIGLACALMLGSLISSRLYGLTSADPLSIALAALVILGTAVLAGYIPARRASRIDPMASLRCE
jgi:predicted permease